jgi:hypothetical protein
MLLDAVALPVREIVHRVDFPFVTGAMMVIELNTIHQRITQVHIRGMPCLL